MNARPHYLLKLVALLGIAVLWPAGPVCAQAAPEGAEGQPRDEEAVREQSIYIPYEKLRQVFEKHGRGVFLPYEKFQELWQAAREQTRPAAEQKPPVGALITEIENEATVSKDVVRVKARLKIEVLAEGWNEIPLRLADAAITSATLGGQPARIVGAANQDYRLLVEKKGKQPEQIELSLEYAKAISRAPGQNSVSFQAPQAPVSRWRVQIPQSGVKVSIYPLIAATEVPAAENKGPGGRPTGGTPVPPGGTPVPPEATPVPPADQTVVLAFVGAAPTVRIDWTPKAEGATGLEALASVQAEQQVWVGEGVTRTRTRLAYTISRAEITQLAIEVPADQKVVGVFDPNVRQWSVEKVNDRQRITAQLFQPAKDSQQVTVELEKFADEKPTGDTGLTPVALQVPVVKALGADRQQGVLVVQVAEGLRATATPKLGLLQIDAAELPASLAGGAPSGSWDFAYRCAAGDFALELQIEKVQPRITADALVEAVLEPERLSLDLSVIYTVERAGVFQLELDVPAGFELRQVSGRAIAGAKAAEVDSYDVQGEGAVRRLLVNLSRKAAPRGYPASSDPKGDDGRVGLVVKLQKPLPQSNLLTPGGKQEIALPIPRVAPKKVEQATGRLVVYAPESLLVNLGKPEGMRSVSFKEALEGMQPGGGPEGAPPPQGVRPVLAFTFAPPPAAAGLVTLQLSAERRKPQVTIRQLLVARIDSGVVKYEATFFYEVLYSGVESIWIDVPSEVSVGLRNETKTVHEEKVANPPPEYAAKGDAWKFTGETELLGEGQIRLVWEQNIEKLGIGKSVDLVVPYLKPLGVNRAWGQVVLAKAETIDVQEKGQPTVLQPIDPQHDLIAPAGTIPGWSGAARAFEFHDDWALTVIATQYKLEEVKRTSLEQSVVRMVVTRADQVSVQALYHIRSARQRLQVKLPAEAEFDTEPARINGRPVVLQGGDTADGYLVPLVDSSADVPFVLELRYMVPGDAGQLDLPQFPEEPAVQKVYLCVYLPEEKALLGTLGPWTEEFTWRLDPALRWKPFARQDAARLIGQLCQGVKLTGNPAETFPTDGQLYVFSTLRPADPPDGSLQMKVFREIALSAIVFLAVILGGLLLLPAGLSRRALAVGALIVALVLCGVFLPTLSLRILNGVLASAVFLVLVVWVVWYFARTRPQAVAQPPRGYPAAAPGGYPATPPPVQEPAAARPPTPQPPPREQARPNSEEGGATNV